MPFLLLFLSLSDNISLKGGVNLRNYEIDKFAANTAKEIVVAMASSFNFPVDAESGKAVSEFYSEIFNGIAETLGNSNLDTTNL